MVADSDWSTILCDDYDTVIQSAVAPDLDELGIFHSDCPINLRARAN